MDDCARISELLSTLCGARFALAADQLGQVAPHRTRAPLVALAVRAALEAVARLAARANRRRDLLSGDANHLLGERVVPRQAGLVKEGRQHAAAEGKRAHGGEHLLLERRRDWWRRGWRRGERRGRWCG
eukprot:5604814-Prymnesium_polylepis.1